MSRVEGFEDQYFQLLKNDSGCFQLKKKNKSFGTLSMGHWGLDVAAAETGSN